MDPTTPPQQTALISDLERTLITMPTLPNEMLALIIESVPATSLPNLCLVCRPLREIAVVKLYRDIYFRDMGQYMAYEERCRTAIDTEQDLAEMAAARALFSTRITNLSLFIRTMRESSSLKSHVSRAKFEWGDDIEDGPTTRLNITAILGLIGKQLKSLHYKSPYWDYDAAQLPLSSVDMPYPSDVKQIGRHHVYSLFSVPTLREVKFDCYDHVRWVTFSTTPSIAESRFSSVTSFSFYNYQMVGKDLREIMTWPKALKIFKCKLEYMAEFLYPTVPWIQQLLWIQRESLEEVILEASDGGADSEGDLGISLRSFPKLKRLALPTEYLLSSCLDMVLEVPDGHICQVIPPNLEELHLDITEDYLDNQLHRPPQDYEGPENGLRGLNRQMQHLASHKQEYCPSLKRVVLWSSRDLRSKRPFGDRCRREEEYINRLLVVTQNMEKPEIEFSFKILLKAPEFS